MEPIQCYMEKDSEMSIDKLIEQIAGEKPTVNTIKSKFKDIYGDRILISHSKDAQSRVYDSSH